MNKDIHKFQIHRISPGLITAVLSGDEDYEAVYEYHVANSPHIITHASAAEFLEYVEGYDGIEMFVEEMHGHNIDHKLVEVQVYKADDVFKFEYYINKLILRFPDPNGESLFILAFM